MSNEKQRLLGLALPVIIENFLQGLMGLLDSYLVAQLGVLALSGVSVANNLLSIYQALYLALAAGVSALLAQQLGAKNQQGQEQVVRDSLALTVLLGLILAILSFFLGRFMLTSLGLELAVREQGLTYLSLVGGGIVFLGLMLTLSAIARVQGRVKLPLWVSLLTNLLNFILSALAVFVWHWGVAGVALATVFSRLCGVLILLWKLALPKLAGYHLLNQDLLTLVLPTVGERLMMRLGDVVTVALLATLGTQVIAGNSIGEALIQFNYLPATGIATATLILVAEAYGSKDYDSLGKILRQSYLSALWLMLLLSGSIWLLGDVLIGLFTTQESLVTLSRIVLFYAFIGSPVTAAVLVLTGFWQGVGRTKLPLYATSWGMWLVRIGLGYFLIQRFRLTGLWLATLLDNLWRMLYLLHHYRKWCKGVLLEER